MKKITFKSLRLLNFCGIREGEYKFHDGLTKISASNGKGKSTIMRAIFYTMFGTEENAASFDIKTYDKEHNIIPEIEHSSELLLSVNDEDILLKRTLTDKWKGDECKNTYKYFINGELATAGDYKKFIENICPEITFRLVSSPTFFVSLPWDKQRKILESLVPEITTETITQGNKRYDFVVEALKKETIDKIIHHIKYRRTEIQKELDNIPVRLSTLDAALPEAENWEQLAVELENKNKEKLSLDKQIYNITNGAADQVHKEAIRKQLEFQRKRIDEMGKGARNISTEESVKHQSDLISANVEKTKAESVVNELKSKMQGFTEAEIQLNAQIEQQKEDIKKAGEEYQKINAERWAWNSSEEYCPHCGQMLPADNIRRIKQDAEKRFNENKAERLKKLLDEAEKIKKENTESKALFEQLTIERTTATNQLTKAHKVLNEAKANLDNVEKETPRSYEDILNANANYHQATEEIKNLEIELDKPVETDEETNKMLAELQSQKQCLEEEIKILNEKLAKKESYDKVCTLIKAAKEDKKTFQQQLDEKDNELDIATDYYQMSCSVLEDRVNEHFQFVKFCLFKTNLDGEKKPFCECYHDGVPFSRLNTAAKVNAGIDIAYTFAAHYDISAPIVLDECESNLNPISRGGQQIRFYVSHDDKLKFEYGD